MERLSESIETYQNHSTTWIDQLLAENQELRIKAAQLTFELNQLRARIFREPVRLQEVVNG